MTLPNEKHAQQAIVAIDRGFLSQRFAIACREIGFATNTKDRKRLHDTVAVGIIDKLEEGGLDPVSIQNMWSMLENAMKKGERNG